jgi:hypothetical protein
MGPPITSADVRGRDAVHRSAPSDPDGALVLARAIHHPWYRCQALTYVAESLTSRSRRLVTLESALLVAQEQEEINRIVTVSAWPLRVMAGIDAASVGAHLRRLVELAEKESHSLRRADALSTLAHSVQEYPELLAHVAPSLVEALLDGRGWRIDRLIRSAVPLVGQSMPEAMEKLVAHHSDGAKKRALLKSLGTMS